MTATSSRSEIAGSVLLAIGADNLNLLEELFGAAFADDLHGSVNDRLRCGLPLVASVKETGQRKLIVGLSDWGYGEVRQLIEKLQADIASDTIHTTLGPVAVTVSVGLVDDKSIPEDMREAAALHALHQAMMNGPGSFRVARDESALIAYRNSFMTAARTTVSAMREGELTLAYQPVVRASGSTIIAFHECLARIRTESGDLLKAASFLPAIERLGLAPLIDRRVLTMALETLRAHPKTRLSLNIFPHTMQDHRWREIFEDAAETDPSLIDRLIVEVTESAAMLDADRTCAFMDALRVKGVSFAMDDFGAGHTSFLRLREFRFDILKIDGRLTRGIDMDPDRAFLVQTVVEIGKRFEMATVAESVQSMSEARTLRDLGAEYFQGFQFGSPSLILSPTESPMPMVAAQV